MGGNSPSIEYSVPISKKIPGQSPVYRNPLYKDKLLDGPSEDVKQIKTAILKACDRYSTKNCLGTIIRKQGQQEYVKYINYAQFLEVAIQAGSGIINKGLAYQPEGENLKFMGIFSKNRAQWTIIDFACILYKITTIPLYDTLGDQNISYVFDHTKLTTVCANASSIKSLMKCQNLVNVKHIICFDKFTDEQKKYFQQKSVNLIPYESILASGQKNIQDYKKQQYKVKPEDCLTFCYTSGTTGPPKGAMLSHKNYCSFLGACISNKDVKFGEDDVVLSYLPLPHVLERQQLYALLSTGGTIAYFSGDVQKIKEDLALVKPTIFVSVPRLFSRFYDGLKKKMGEVQGLKKTVLDCGLSSKISQVQRSGGVAHPFYDRVVFSQSKAALGGRARLMISGSAPLLPEVHKFLKVTMAAPLLEGYGQTQSTGASFITYAEDPEVGHVGGPVSNIEFKLVDIPDMQYTSDDVDDKGRPTPRGQIWMRGPGVFLGYYKSQDKTKETLTPDGWLKSGDVGVILPTNKGLKIIDRKKNIFKLSQGEYVAAEKVQNFYLNCPLIAQIFLHGESSQSFAIVFVCPDKKRLQQKAKSLGIQGSFEELCKNKKLKIQVLKEMNEIGKKKGLKSFQLAKNIYLQPNGFQSKNILTTTMKVQRHEAKKVYKKEIEEMYNEGTIEKQKGAQ